MEINHPVIIVEFMFDGLVKTLIYRVVCVGMNHNMLPV